MLRIEIHHHQHDIPRVDGAFGVRQKLIAFDVVERQKPIVLQRRLFAPHAVQPS